jgi:Fe-S-cluster containining protein
MTVEDHNVQFAMAAVNLHSFRQKKRYHKKSFRRFLGRLKKNPPGGLDALAEKIDKEVWKEVDCVTCANCCKTMTPTFTLKDIKRISAHLQMTVMEFKNKWLRYEKQDKEWVNNNLPCQFLDLNTNMCSIYEVRPDDCAGFPHLKKRKMVDYMHVHQQNVEYCPATYRMVEKMKAMIYKK